MPRASQIADGARAKGTRHASNSTSSLELATSSYHDVGLIRASGLAPVGITLGLPRSIHRYRVNENITMLAPFELLDLTNKLGAADIDEFCRRYRARLDRVGADRVLRMLTVKAARAARPGLVLLCHEPPGVFCHRRVLAEWIEERLGLEVPELKPCSAAARDADDLADPCHPRLDERDVSRLAYLDHGL